MINKLYSRWHRCNRHPECKRILCATKHYRLSLWCHIETHSPCNIARVPTCAHNVLQPYLSFYYNRLPWLVCPGLSIAADTAVTFIILSRCHSNELDLENGHEHCQDENTPGQSPCVTCFTVTSVQIGRIPTVAPHEPLLCAAILFALWGRVNYLPHHAPGLFSIPWPPCEPSAQQGL